MGVDFSKKKFSPDFLAEFGRNYRKPDLTSRFCYRVWQPHMGWRYTAWVRLLLRVRCSPEALAAHHKMVVGEAGLEPTTLTL